MSTKATLKLRAYRAGEQVYTYELTNPRTAKWLIDLSFPHRLEMRVAAGAHGMAEPTVYAGKHHTQMLPLDESKLPRALAAKVKEVTRSVMLAEHSNALANNTPPAPNRITWYAEQGHLLTAEQTKEADRISSIIGGVFADPQEVTRAAVRIALSTVSATEHERIVEGLDQDLADALLNTIPAAKPQNFHDVKVELEEIAIAADEAIDRMRREDLLGTYGDTVLEQAAELWEPLINRIDELVATISQQAVNA